MDDEDDDDHGDQLPVRETYAGAQDQLCIAMSSGDSLLGLRPQLLSPRSPTSDFGYIPQIDGGDDLIDFDVPSAATPLLPGRGDVITGISLTFIPVFWLCPWWSSFCFQYKLKSMLQIFGSGCGLTAGVLRPS